MSEATEQTQATEPTPTPYDLLGGEAGVRRLAESFYRVMDASPEAAGIRAMHGADLAPITQYLFEWLSGWLGGPALYIQRKGTPCLTAPHRAFKIGDAERDQWMFCMRGALDQTEIGPELRALLERAFGQVASMLRNQPSDAGN